MPFLADEELLDLEFVRSDLVQSDILNSVEATRGYAGEATNDSGAGPSVVAIEEQKMPTPTLKKRGRPSLSRSQTPAKPSAAKTPRSTKKVATPKSSGLMRKAPEPEEQDEEDVEEETAEEPAKKRGRPAARAAAVVTSTRLSASKPTRGRPKSTTATSTEAAKPAKGKGGRPKTADTNSDGTPADEYEVEEIIEAAVDSVSKEHMYLVKWKGYPSSQNTWEPKENLSHASELLKAFDGKKQESDKTDATAVVDKRQKRQTKAADKAEIHKKTGKVAEKPKKTVGRPKRTRSG